MFRTATLGTVGAALLALAGGCRCPASAPPGERARFPVIDVHVHAAPRAVPNLVRLMDRWGLETAVNLSGGWPGEGLEASLAAARAAPGRVLVFCTPPLHRAAQGGAWASSLPRELRRAHQLGCRGVKIFKSLGLSIVDADGRLLAVDDPALDALFDEAGALGMPVAIHTGDPQAFWRAPGPDNERRDELSVHPGWSYAGRPVPSWEALFAAYERRVARHPRTTFIGVHFGNDPEEPQRVAAMLDRLPNLYVDTAARVPELGRQDPAVLRALFVAHQDRILFGTDLGVGEGPDQLMLGSSGATPPTAADQVRFFTATWRFFETADRGFPHPTPIQGRWTIDGLGLPPEVLRKLYAENARRVLGLPARGPDAP
jgi:predicted TIM-barrel fold metal-dependent hydrolase